MKNNRDTISAQKREYWLKHLSEWEISKLSQESYCKKAEISYSSFTYWRGQISLESGQSKQRQFLPVKIQKPAETISDIAPPSIKIKLITGNLISIPMSVGMDEIAKLIRILEIPNA